MSLQAFRVFSESTKGNVMLTISGLGLLAISRAATQPGVKRVGLTIAACGLLAAGAWRYCHALMVLFRTGPSSKEMHPKDRRPYIISTGLSCVVCLALAVLIAYALIQSISGALSL